MYKMTKKELEKRVEILEGTVLDTFWMARRYACGRASIAPSIIRENYKKLKGIGIMIPRDDYMCVDGTINEHTIQYRDFLNDCNE